MTMNNDFNQSMLTHPLKTAGVALAMPVRTKVVVLNKMPSTQYNGLMRVAAEVLRAGAAKTIKCDANTESNSDPVAMEHCEIK